MKKYIKSLTKLKAKKSNFVAFVSHTVDPDDAAPKPVFNIKPIDELEGSSYGLDLTPIKEALAIKIVMTWKTQHYLYELLADIINDLTVFGWGQERLAEEEEKLDKAIQAAEDHPDNFISLDELMEEFGIDERDFDHFDREEYMLMRKVLRDLGKLYDHSMKRETGKVKKALVENGIISDE